MFFKLFCFPTVARTFFFGRKKLTVFQLFYQRPCTTILCLEKLTFFELFRFPTVACTFSLVEKTVARTFFFGQLTFFQLFYQRPWNKILCDEKLKFVKLFLLNIFSLPSVIFF